MSETQRIAQLFADWHDQNPWTEIKLMDLLAGVTPEMAAAHPIPGANSIWQLVQHCLGWRENVLRKLQGEVFKSPEDNYLGEPTDTSPEAWSHLLDAIAQNNQAWQQFLLSLPDTDLEKGYAPANNAFTQYAVIHGLLHHDNYHFGQILMLKKMAQHAAL